MPRGERLPAARRYRDLIVWQKSMELVKQSYRVVAALPAAERHELGKQLKRSCVSIARTIAEGAGRRHQRDYARFLSMARGSQAEAETYLEIIDNLSMAPRELTNPAAALAEEIGRMLTAMLHRRYGPRS